MLRENAGLYEGQLRSAWAVYPQYHSRQTGCPAGRKDSMYVLWKGVTTHRPLPSRFYNPVSCPTAKVKHHLGWGFVIIYADSVP